MDHAERIDILSNLEVFRNVEPTTLEAVADLAESRSVAAGEYLFREGDPANAVFVILEGTLEVRKAAAEGVEITLRRMGRGEAGGLTSMAVPKQRSASLKAEGPVSVLLVPRERFLQLVDAHPDLARAVIELLGNKVRGKTSQLADYMASTQPDGRFAVAVFDAKPYDRRFLDAAAGSDVRLHYFENRLSSETASLARGFPAVCAFVNDELDGACIDQLAAGGVRLIALRCAGFNNVDLAAAQRRGISVVRVPGYSPHAVAEHTVALILTLNRKTHRAYQRVREGNFSLSGLVGFDLYGRTAGVVGTGKIGRCLAEVLRGLGMELLAFDPYPDEEFAARVGARYVELNELLSQSDVITLNAPLTEETHHMIDADAIDLMRRGVMLINTGRGALIHTTALIEGLKSGKIGAAGLDVYEEESEYFFQDRSEEPITDDTLARLLTFPNVLVTSHQAFLTSDALGNIASTTLSNIREFREGAEGAALQNAVMPGAGAL
jgi:D-lactate dehydrogenase